MMRHAILAAICVMMPVQVLAHTTLIETEIRQGIASRFTLNVPHGCGSEATLRLRVRIPAGIVAVKPMPKAGWDLEIVTTTYETPQMLGETEITEGVTELIWNGNLPDAYFDEFAFRGTVTEANKVGSTLYLPAVQECATGVERWIELPAEGQNPHDLARPAPGVKIAPSGMHHH